MESSGIVKKERVRFCLQPRETGESISLVTLLPIVFIAVLCCAVLCCAVLCCAVLCCAVLCCAVLYCHTSSVLIHSLFCQFFFFMSDLKKWCVFGEACSCLEAFCGELCEWKVCSCWEAFCGKLCE